MIAWLRHILFGVKPPKTPEQRREDMNKLNKNINANLESAMRELNEVQEKFRREDAARRNDG